jgi:hypothetical protein
MSPPPEVRSVSRSKFAYQQPVSRTGDKCVAFDKKDPAGAEASKRSYETHGFRPDSTCPFVPRNVHPMGAFSS